MDLNNLKGDDITIIGHANPDVDSIVSGILLNKLLNFLKIESTFIIPDGFVEDKISTILHKFNIAVTDFFCGDISENLSEIRKKTPVQ